MKQPTLVTLLVVVALAGCTTAPRGTAPHGDNSRNSLDWPGVYVGTIPCADCEGIRMRIELHSDGTFARTLTYLGRDVRPFADGGSFEWDDSGARVTLKANARDATQYRVGENALIALDRNGQPIGGGLAAAYRLDKLAHDPRIEGRRWQLFELDGQAVTPPAGRDGPYFELDGAAARVTGNASCNRFFGPYELTAGNHLRFGPNFGATMMACPQLDRERAFLAMLMRVDSYALGDGTLSLNDAGKAPLARFRAVSE